VTTSTYPLPYRQTYIEYRKLTSTPAAYVAAAVMVGLAVVGLAANVLLAGTNGMPALGTTATVSKSLSERVWDLVRRPSTAMAAGRGLAPGAVP
jgi:hypothetical protein